MKKGTKIAIAIIVIVLILAACIAFFVIKDLNQEKTLISELDSLYNLIEADNTTTQEPKVGNNDMKNNEKQQANQEQQQKKQENPKKESALKDKWNNFFEAVKRIFTKIINRIKSIFSKITNSELKNIPDKTMITDWDYKNDIIGKLDELINSTNNIILGN